jgi:Uri superfamily endonuclease
MDTKSGTYALVFQSFKTSSIQIGHWGCFNINPGYYIYVGSAFGPGGVKARVARHCRKIKSKHWHIDYLREHVELIFAWYSNNPMKLEHQWAQALLEMKETSPVKGFGCSDCKCYTHLFNLDIKPTLACFMSAVNSPVKSWFYKPTE